MSLLLGYLVVGYVVAIIFASFFTKVSIIQLSKENKIEIKSEKSCIILPLKFFNLKFFKLIVILANTNDEIFGYSKIFQLKYGWVFLISSLFWPVFLVILGFHAFGAILGKQLPPNGSLD